MVKNVAGLAAKSYEGRLAELGMTTLEKRRADQDLVQAFKIIRGHDDVEKEMLFTLRSGANSHHTTRAAASGLNIIGQTSRLELRKNFFSERVADSWNNLSDITKSASSVREFKGLLKAPQHQHQHQ